MKKQVLTLLLSMIGIGAFSQTASWVSQASNFTPVSSGVRYVSAVDSNVVWICSYDGSGGGANRQDFSRTTNGGALWTAGTTGAPTNYDWSMIYGVNADTAFAMYFDAVAGSGGGIWRTTDGGATWTQLGVGSIFNANSFPDVVHFWNSNDGWAMGDPNNGYFEMYTTHDGGNTWTRVPQANIPANLSGEYGIVGHYSVIGDNIWFDTQKGRVYRSNDRGQTWRVSSTGITVPSTGAIDICFYSASQGIARLYTATTGVSIVKTTSDSGATWTTLATTGNFWGSDVKYVPGTVSKLVSTGADATNGFTGSSYSNDGGATWVDIESGTQRTALGIADSSHMWCGGFTSSPTAGGIYKYTIIPSITCGDPLISAGTVTATDTFICDGETVTITASGVYAPTVGDFAGVSWVVTSADISGSGDPLNEPSIVASYGFLFPAPATAGVNFTNDGTLIGGGVGYGLYYWTPVVFGNATGTAPTFLGDLTLDLNCVYTGNSIAVYVADPNDSACTGVGVSEVNKAGMNLTAFQTGESSINIRFAAERSGVAALQIVDMAGRVIYNTENQPITKGINFVRLNTPVSAGTYIVKANVNGTVAATKFVKQ